MGAALGSRCTGGAEGGFLHPSPWARCWWVLMLFGCPGLSPWPGQQLLTSSS